MGYWVRRAFALSGLAMDARERLSPEEAFRLYDELAAARARIQELERLADTDTLTPLPNRRAFMREVARTVEAVMRHGTSAAVAFVDIDSMKAINDRWGHQAGDAALCHVAEILSRSVRGTDLVARIGGDEFGLLLDRLDEHGAASKAAALVAAIAAEPVDLGPVSVEVGVSLGLAMVEPGDTVEAVLARADARMYAAKAQRSAR